MKRIPMVLVAIVSGLTLFGCGKAEEVYSVEWYKENEQARMARLDKCESSPELVNTPNCINAEAARNELLKEIDEEMDKIRKKMMKR